jgi:hypothetical protein
LSEKLGGWLQKWLYSRTGHEKRVTKNVGVKIVINQTPPKIRWYDYFKQFTNPPDTVGFSVSILGPKEISIE